MDSEDVINAPHEGEWIYVSAPLGHLNRTAQALAERITTTIYERGWTVVWSAGDGEDGDVRNEREAVLALEALRLADACLFDVSSLAVGAELATAVCAGRPVIALEHIDNPPSRIVSALLRDQPLPRVIRYTDVDDCVEQLTRTLEDPAWLAAVGVAAADVG